jgi:protein involved in polysaccharide export with SLBB domain
MEASLQTLSLRFQILCVAFLILSSMWMGAAYAQTWPQQDPRLPQQDPWRLPPPQWPRTSPATRSGSPGGAERTEGSGPPVIVYGDDDYKLAPRDVVEVIVEDAPELSVNYTINSRGVIQMRFLGPLLVVGKTTEELTKIITDGLRGRYLQDPQVYVSVKQYNSRTFFIQGAVRNPGVYVVSGKPSLFRLLTIAGGLQENHGLVAYIFRETAPKPEKLETGHSQNGADSKINQFVKEAKGEANVGAKVETKVENGVGKDQGGTQGGTNGGSQGGAVAKGAARGTATATEGEPDYEMMTANIGGVFRGRLDNNIIVQPGDLVYIPPADVFYVAGDVRAPGQYPLRQGITLRQAVSLAGGTRFQARLGKGVIFRTDPVTGNFTELPVDIGAVVSGKSPDMPILGNDVVWIPNSAAKSIGSTFLNLLIPLSVYRIPGI